MNNKQLTKNLVYQLLEANRINEDAKRLDDLSQGKITLENWNKLREDKYQENLKVLDE